MFDLCPWYLAASGPAGHAFLPEPLALPVALAPERGALGRGDARRRSSRERERPSAVVAPSGSGSRPGRRSHCSRSSERGSLLHRFPRSSSPSRSPCTPHGRGPRSRRCSGERRVARLGAWLTARRYAEPELPEADLGVVRLDRREATPRGGPSGVVPREPLERPWRDRSAARSRRTSVRSPAGSPIPNGCTGEPGRQRGRGGSRAWARPRDPAGDATGCWPPDPTG